MSSLPPAVDILGLYRTELRRSDFSFDPAQSRVAEMLDDLQRRLISAGPNRSGGLRSLFRRPESEPQQGLYVWGDTGRGKTWLVDLFFEALPFPDKLRKHFHRFMADVHEELADLGDRQDPLDIVAEKLAETTRILCFDEFFVADIADAMILGTLFDGLFRRGVSLVATSNVPPTELYRDGLQRARFLPAIELLEKHTRTVHLDGSEDYRLRTLERAEIYHSPLDQAARDGLTRSFEGIAPEACWRKEELVIKGRIIPSVRRADGVAWFDFADICDGPRSQADYIEIARSFHSVLVSNVPRLDETLENQARRFIALVDEFYDRNVTLILSAAVPLEDLYEGKRLAFEFRRTRSRLEEMQSRDYLAKAHLP
jgi:cell division protein ZapE